MNQRHRSPSFAQPREPTFPADEEVSYTWPCRSGHVNLLGVGLAVAVFVRPHVRLLDRGTGPWAHG